MYKNRKPLFPLPELIDVKEPVIVSLTSYKHRIAQIKPTLKTLWNQTRKPDRVVLYLAYEDRQYVYPELEVLCEIRYCEDTKSHKKFNGFYDFPDCYVVTADDDLLYKPNWLEDLLRVNQIGNHKYVSAHNTFLLNGYSFGRATTRRDNAASMAGTINMYVMSGAGVLVPPGIDLHELKEAYKYSEHCDEKPLSMLLAVKHIPVLATGMNADEHHTEAYRNGISLWDMYNCKHQKERWEETKNFITSVLKNQQKIIH